MPQHALGREYHQRLAPLAQCLPPEEVEILRRRRGLADLDVVARRELEIALDTRAGVLRSLAFVSVGEKKNEAAQQSPLVLARRDELVDDDLRSVSEITELGLPKGKRFGIVAAVAVFKSHDARFRQR